jgi:microcystin-dependent protein
MAITYVQAFPPLWYIVGKDGLAAGGAQMFTYDSITRQPKPVYQDPSGNLAWRNPVIFDLNGTNGPFYWKEDSVNPTDLYYVEVYDKEGTLLWQENNFPASGSGGGGNVTTILTLVNYITNNQFINNIGAQAGPLPTNLVVAPSNHKGFTPALTNPIVGTYGVLGPDIRFVKNNTNAVDSLSFPEFPLSSSPLTNDVTPVNYVRYQSNSATGETYKSFQFPITQKVKNLSNQIMTFGVWAAVTTTPVDIQAYCRQYYGSGTGATPESVSTRTLIGSPMSLTSTWQWFPRKFTVPNVSGNSLGTPGLQTDDDAIYIQIDMPLDQPCDVLFTKPVLFIGTADPDNEFDSYDMIDSIDQTPRTGDIRVSYWTSAPLGWVPMNDGTIGNVGSGATLAAGQYTFQLYKTLWDAVSNTYAPVTGGRGATALADFLANKTMRLPLSLGRALAAAGSGSGIIPTVLGQSSGSDTHVITIGEMPTHDHPGSTVTTGAIAGITPSLATQNATIISQQAFVTVAPQGNNTPMSIIQNTSYMNVFIKL